MKRFALACIVGLSALTSASPSAYAAIEAGAFLDISAFKIINDATDLPVVVGTDITISGPIIDQSSVSAEMNGLTSAVGMPPGPAFPSLDAPIVYSDGTSIVPTVADGTMSPRPLAVTLPYGRADTEGGGSAVTPPGGPVTTGAGVQTIADVVIPNTTLIANTGASTASATTTSFVVTIPTSLSVYFDFDALVDVTLDYDPNDPLGLLLFGKTSFVVTATGTGGAAVGTSVSYKPDELNAGYTRVTEGITNPGDGTLTSFTSPTFTLPSGSYVFTITQGAAASIAPVPEAASIMTWLGLTLAGVVATYVKRQSV